VYVKSFPLIWGGSTVVNVDDTVTVTFTETAESAGEVNFSGCEGEMGSE
jgi:hypothetical protein